jgi:N-acetylglutamate synthase-like GNAT family acetyltransferase
MTTIKITNKLTPRLNSFSDDVWKIADMHRYGRKTDWKKQTKVIQAYEKEKLVGLLELTIEAGVMHIADLVVNYAHQKQDIGTTLMQQAEVLAQKEQVHKIF